MTKVRFSLSQLRCLSAGDRFVLTVGDADHRMIKILRVLGLDGAAPRFTICYPDSSGSARLKRREYTQIARPMGS